MADGKDKFNKDPFVFKGKLTAHSNDLKSNKNNSNNCIEIILY